MSGSPDATVESEAGGVELELVAEASEDPGVGTVTEHAGSVVVGHAVLALLVVLVGVPLVKGAAVVAVVECGGVLFEEQQEALAGGRIENLVPHAVLGVQAATGEGEGDDGLGGEKVEGDVEDLGGHLEDVGGGLLRLGAVGQRGCKGVRPALGVQDLHLHYDSSKRAVSWREWKHKTLMFEITREEEKKKKKARGRPEERGQSD